MKFTNPIWDYKHILVNRILHYLIELWDLINNFKIGPEIIEEVKKDSENFKEEEIQAP